MSSYLKPLNHLKPNLIGILYLSFLCWIELPPYRQMSIVLFCKMYKNVFLRNFKNWLNQNCTWIVIGLSFTEFSFIFYFHRNPMMVTTVGSVFILNFTNSETTNPLKRQLGWNVLLSVQLHFELILPQGHVIYCLSLDICRCLYICHRNVHWIVQDGSHDQ